MPPPLPPWQWAPCMQHASVSFTQSQSHPFSHFSALFVITSKRRNTVAISANEPPPDAPKHAHEMCRLIEHCSAGAKRPKTCSPPLAARFVLWHRRRVHEKVRSSCNREHVLNRR